MKLPEVIQDLIDAQNNADSTAYANCFSEMAKVLDEGKTYIGKAAIESWINESNEKYSAVMKPVSFEGNTAKGVLKSEVSGNFPGSPILLHYNFEFEEERISYLTIN
ncbi:nuclear transport factor 2 family protein [Flavobacterium sp. HTF]|uniref:nuclear transport factor 2 family protein n=1 Tax=Flavobacterium sp. HTF TaxID=2170732 RepID=UPI000D5F6BB1|nr:nuclear transport factor 2 family protein [Flavobacterium sp. HTF]PWB27325.1 hypothetical protein DCO46_03475 [Flavobacterium sp. HTF]